MVLVLVLILVGLVLVLVLVKNVVNGRPWLLQRYSITKKFHHILSEP